MPRPLTLMVAVAALGSVPVAALAQAWPATVVGGAPQMTARPLKASSTRASSLRTADLRRAAGTRALKMSPSIEAEEVPDVDLRARAEWSDDQGFRVSPTRVAFKRRF